MARALALAVLIAAPAAAAVPAPAPGTIVFTQGTNDLVRGPWISRAECLDAAAVVNLSWTAQLAPAVTFPADATYQLYASNQPVAGLACPTASNTSTGLLAGPVGPAIAGEGPVVAMWPHAIADLLAAAGLADCASVPADTQVYVCAQAYAPGATPVGIAIGTMTLSIAAPAQPTSASAAPWDDGALQISWQPATGGAPAYDYRVVAAGDGDPAVHELVATATYAALTGLVNDVPYRIQVYARSQAGNESAPAETTGTPMRGSSVRGVLPWGPDTGQGGCGTPGATPLALLWAAALLARRRTR